MDLKFVQTLLDVLESSTALSEIEYGDGQRQVKLERRSSRPSPTAGTSEQLVADLAPALAEEADGPEAPTATTTRNSVIAGMIGTFYRSPAPNQPSFVSVGDTVEEGQTLAIVEAMKLLNPIESDRAGRIAEILVADGAAISADTPLFVIEKLEAAHV
ncbi:acetyl-CoA carboxylase biotin carboxyl carrier protein subunit [Cupriavidus sp. 2TAF22]|uniref:acetyl-CoA carboxylase biotin carboxyl carrier protein n=1 Tax=unclassified Cupriavidus TaxID=2640874 RepID=UPI003F9102B2